MKKNSRTPWLDKTGSIFTDVELAKISKEWSAEEWEHFLAATVDKEMAHTEVHYPGYEKLCEEVDASLWEEENSVPAIVQNEITNALEKLDARSRRIIEASFWNSLSVRKIAEAEKISKSRVDQIKHDALKTIKVHLEFSLDTFSYLENSAEIKCSGRYLPDIYETYLSDLKGRFLPF